MDGAAALFARLPQHRRTGLRPTSAKGKLRMKLADLSSAELRLELAEAEASRPRSHRATWIKKDRVAAVTKELVERGCF